MKARTGTQALLAVTLAALGPGAAALEKSAGVYRVPYQNGTEVEVTNDHQKHDPPGRIDMHGESGGTPYKVVAAADGTIRFIVDNFSKRVDSSSGDPCTNNYVWIEHAHGEWTKYSHMTQDSTTKKAKLKVGQFVKAGTYLGDEGQVGCASGPHLHFEVGVPRASNPITTTGGFLQDNDGSKRNRIPRICGIAGGIFDSGQTYEARNVPGNLTPGSKEVARHGVPAEDYQCLFDQATAANYEPAWVDGFDFGGKVYYNAVFRPRTGVAWASFHGLSGADYQEKFDHYVGQGYRPTLVDIYRGSGGARYAVIFRKDGGPQFVAYHGLSAGDHQARMDDLSGKGFRPRVMSVASIGGDRRYAAIYDKANVGSWVAKSALTPAQYQQLFNQNAQAGRQVAYLNGYEHDGQPYLTAIWSSATQGAWKARHNLTSSQYQAEWESAHRGGLLTRNVSGYEAGNTLLYAAIWRK